ncbi:hypothetical protein [Bradyrhizobium sp. B117]|uniref:hypothetical protein n=1 Tax=Bradyrhizobium sp. B117 TaxID=3140246 RepID=UPI00318309FB
MCAKLSRVSFLTELPHANAICFAQLANYTPNPLCNSRLFRPYALENGITCALVGGLSSIEALLWQTVQPRFDEQTMTLYISGVFSCEGNL